MIILFSCLGCVSSSEDTVNAGCIHLTAVKLGLLGFPILVAVRFIFFSVVIPNLETHYFLKINLVWPFNKNHASSPKFFGTFCFGGCGKNLPFIWLPSSKSNWGKKLGV